MEENLRYKALKLKDQQNVEYLIKLKLNNGFIFQHSKRNKQKQGNKKQQLSFAAAIYSF